MIADGNDYADFLLARPEVSGTAIGAQGYCMGGRLTLVAAGGLGGKLAAAASFHAAGIAVADDPNSPHLAADEINAAVFVAGSASDPGSPPSRRNCSTARSPRPGLRTPWRAGPGGHGFAVADMPVYDAALDERHWQVLSDLYAERLS